MFVFQPNSNNAPTDQNVDPLPDIEDEMGDDLFNEISEGGIDMSDLFGSLSPVGSPNGSPKNMSAPGSPMHGMGGPMSPTMNGPGKGGMSGPDPQDDPGNLLQQPLAMGFYTSSAPTGPLPKWFWSACPHREGICPTCLKVHHFLTPQQYCILINFPFSAKCPKHYKSGQKM